MKRVIGKSSIDSVIDTSRKYWTFNLVQDPELGLSVEVNVNNETKRVSPEEISSYVLKKMKETAEKHTMTPVTKAVITVPAYFNQEQKRATVRAAELAGLEVPDLITEPAAAAYAYGFDKEQFNDYNLLVIDLGGGTFDVVIVKVKNGKFTVVAIGGDTQLGGRDFDNMLMNHMHKIILDKYQKDCFENKRTQQKLLKEVVELKHALAGATEARLIVKNR
jgi:heat shock 70kDa protein 1/2/6/8